MKRLAFSMAAICCLSGVVHADVIKDHRNSWQGLDFGWGNFYDSQASTAATCFQGNGQRLSRVGGVMYFNYGNNTPNNPPDPGDFTIRFSYYGSAADYASDPVGLNRPAGWSHEYQLPSNPTYETIIGTAGGNNLYYLELDVSALNIITAPGSAQMFSMVIDDHEIVPGIVGYMMFSTGINAVGQDWDWGYNTTPLLGPDTMHNISAGFGMERNWFASYVETTPVPAPASGVLLGLGGLLIGRRRRS